MDVALAGDALSWLMGASGPAAVGWVVKRGLDGAMGHRARSKAFQLAAVSGLRAALEHRTAPRDQVLGLLDGDDAYVASLHSVLEPAIPKPDALALDEHEARAITAQLVSLWGPRLSPCSAAEVEAVATAFLTTFRRRLSASDSLFAIYAAETLGALEEAQARLIEQCDDVLQELQHQSELLVRIVSALEAGAAAGGAAQARWRRGAQRWLESKTDGVAEPRWFAQDLQRIRRDSSSGYILITGEPGVGKSTIAASTAISSGSYFHWNDRRGGPVTTLHCTEYLGAQHASRGGTTPVGTPALLSDLLLDIAGDGPNVVIIDGIDEAEPPPAGGTPLGLPDELPPGLHVVLTSRPTEEWQLRDVVASIDLDHHDPHRELLKSYIWSRVRTADFDLAVKTLGVERRELVDKLVARADGSFIYARFVLDDLATAGRLPASVDQLPSGLRQYFENNLRRIEDRANPGAFMTMYAICALGVPTTLTELSAQLRGLRNPLEIQSDLRLWRPYLDVDPGLEGHIAVYHVQFAEYFLLYAAAAATFAAQRVQVDEARESRRFEILGP